MEDVEMAHFVEATVSAGFPSVVYDEGDEALDLNKLLIKQPAATFFVRVAGDSMTGAGIHSGDLLVVDRSISPEDGKIVIAVVNGEFTVKRLKISSGKVFLIAENKAYKPLAIGSQEEFQVWGTVTYVIRKVV